MRILQDCDRIVKSTKNIETAVNRCNFAIEKLQYLAFFESLGIEIYSKPCEEMLQEFRKDKNEKIQSILAAQFAEIQKEEDEKKALKKANKLLEVVDLYRSEIEPCEYSEELCRNEFEFVSNRLRQ